MAELDTAVVFSYFVQKTKAFYPRFLGGFCERNSEGERSDDQYTPPLSLHDAENTQDYT